MAASTFWESMSSQLVVVGFWEYDPFPSTKLKDENRPARLDHCVLPEGDEVVVEERDAPTIVGALELDKFCARTTVVAAIPTRTRTRVLDAAKALHS